MAFTNYILMSVIGMFVFYGNGFGQFERFDRLGQMLTVLLIWCIILSVSHFTMGRFRYGPLEWLWRKLTYLNFKN